MKKRYKLKLFKHQALITSITVLVLVIGMIGGSYAIFSSTSKADEYNVLKVGQLEISYVDTGIGYGDILSLNGAYPVSDIVGVENSPYRFSITNTGTITADFKIKILYDEAIIDEDGCENNLLPQEFVKYKFDNGEPALLSSKEDSNYVVYQANNLLPGSSEIHEIRVWIDEGATNQVLGKHFHGKVVVESTQSGIDDSLMKSYNVGQSVELKDGSKWHVLENSNINATNVLLLSDYNLNNDGTYNTGCGKSINNTTVCSPQAFDLSNNRLTTNNSYCITPTDGCNMFTKNGSTVLADSSIKVWLDNTYLPSLKQAITANSGIIDDLTVTLPTMEQLAIADGKTFNQEQITFTSSWLTTTSYWTRTASTLNTSYVWGVVGEYNNCYVSNADSNNLSGVRPIIITSKANIK